MNRTELLQYRINMESRKGAIEARNERIEARRLLADPVPPTGYAELIGLPEFTEAEKREQEALTLAEFAAEREAQEIADRQEWLRERAERNGDGRGMVVGGRL